MTREILGGRNKERNGISRRRNGGEPPGDGRGSASSPCYQRHRCVPFRPPLPRKRPLWNEGSPRQPPRPISVHVFTRCGRPQPAANLASRPRRAASSGRHVCVLQEMHRSISVGVSRTFLMTEISYCCFPLLV